MNKTALGRKNQKVTARGADGEDSDVIVEHEPLDGGDVLRLDRGKIGSDLDGPMTIRAGAGVNRFRPVEDEDQGAVGKSKRVGVEGYKEVGVIHQPAFFSGAEVG